MSSTITVPAHGEGTPAEVVALATQAKADVEALQAQTARTVQDAATGITGTGNATATNSAASTGITGTANATATNNAVATGITASLTRKCAATLVPQAPGATIHAQFAAGAPIMANAGFTVPYPRRTCRVVVGAMGVAVNYTVTGTDIAGNPLNEVIHVGAGGGSVDGLKAFETIATFASDVDPQDTTDLKAGKGFAVAEPFTALDVLGVNDVVEAADNVQAAVATITPHTAPDGAKVFSARYTRTAAATVTDPTHNHTQAAHSHGITDPTHNHTQAAHSHAITDPQHTHALT